MTNPKDFIIVGSEGECTDKYTRPSLYHLKSKGKVGKLFGIDIVDKKVELDGHRIREPNAPLSQIIDSFEINEPIVILNHPNELHAPEASEIFTNSKSNPKVLIDKPYAIDTKGIKTLERIASSHSGRIGLLEYYLTLKSIPLLILGGMIKRDSFYYSDGDIVKELIPGALNLGAKGGYSGMLREMIGKPLFVKVDVLEGAGTTGSIEHRTLSLVDIRLGGGMIQDLGHHSMTPLMALEDYLGKIDAHSIKDVKTAWSKDYTDASLKRGVPKEFIGESYAEISLETSANIPIKIALGKYIQQGKTQRQIEITGTRGVVHFDLSNLVLSVQTSLLGEDYESINRRLKISELFNKNRVFTNNVKNHKPSPDIYLALSKKLGVNPDECIVFEDSPNGIIAALTAGSRVVALTTTFNKKSLIKSTTQLLHRKVESTDVLFIPDYSNESFKQVCDFIEMVNV